MCDPRKHARKGDWSVPLYGSRKVPVVCDDHETFSENAIVISIPALIESVSG
jgi:hypothetical protein